MTRPDEFELLLDSLDGAEAHRSLFGKAWRESREGFATVVAAGLRYSRKPTDYVFAAVIAGEHLTKGRAADGDGTSYWVVHIESGNGVKPHRFATSSEAASFVAGLESVDWISDADPHTREIYVALREKRAQAAPESRAHTHERQAA